MNCYYSNLIEGHNTLPRDIEGALANQFDEEDGRRNLQLEARAHIAAQRLIDLWSREDRLPEPASMKFIQTLHEIFYTDATPPMLEIRARMAGSW
jgi:Fic family protein